MIGAMHALWGILTEVAVYVGELIHRRDFSTVT
jgi:hypothetical protein